MVRRTLLLGVIAFLGACSDRPAAPTAPGTAPASGVTTPAAAPVAAAPGALSAEGVGGIRFGMKLAEAEQAAGGKATLPTPFDPACSMVRFASLPRLRFMVEQGVVARADAEPGVENTLGIAVGDALAQIRAAHPDAQVTAHKYDPNGHTITFPSADGRAAIIAEESGGKLTRIRAGLQPAVAYVETCG